MRLCCWCAVVPFRGESEMGTGEWVCREQGHCYIVSKHIYAEQQKGVGGVSRRFGGDATADVSVSYLHPAHVLMFSLCQSDSGNTAGSVCCLRVIPLADVPTALACAAAVGEDMAGDDRAGTDCAGE